MRRLVVVTLLATGCGRLGFDVPGASDGDLVDAGTGAADGALATPRCDWSAGPPFVAPADRLLEISTADYETDPVLSRDGLRLYFGGTGATSGDVFVASRASSAARFTSASVDPLVSTPSTDENGLIYRADGLEAYFNRAVAGRGSDLFVISRPSLAATFGAPVALDALNSTGNDSDAYVEPDGRTVWFTSDARAGSPGGREVFFATRASSADPWGNVTAAPFATAGDETSARLTDDGLVVVFGEGGEIYYATRPDRSAGFGPRQLLDAANSEAANFESYVTGDGCGLYWVSTRDTGSDWDMYGLTASPPP